MLISEPKRQRLRAYLWDWKEITSQDADYLIDKYYENVRHDTLTNQKALFRSFAQIEIL